MVSLKQMTADVACKPDCTSDCVAHCTLNRLAIGESGTVQDVGGDYALRRRLMEMGFCRGTNVEVVRRSPFGDPIELRLRGYCLSLRDEQARCISVAPAASASVALAK